MDVKIDHQVSTIRYTRAGGIVLKDSFGTAIGTLSAHADTEITANRGEYLQVRLIQRNPCGHNHTYGVDKFSCDEVHFNYPSILPNSIAFEGVRTLDDPRRTGFTVRRTGFTVRRTGFTVRRTHDVIFVHVTRVQHV